MARHIHRTMRRGIKQTFGGSSLGAGHPSSKPEGQFSGKFYIIPGDRQESRSELNLPKNGCALRKFTLHCLYTPQGHLFRTPSLSLCSILRNVNSISSSPLAYTTLSKSSSVRLEAITTQSAQRPWLLFAGAVFLVSVPVFFQAPLVRVAPLLSLDMMLVWWGIASLMRSRPALAPWGDLLAGFAWTWLAGTIYWGWLRWEPLLHLPVEAIGLPFALVSLQRKQGNIGHWFYLGSLLGTAVTDAYFYLVNLIPDWRALMAADPAFASPILSGAVLKVQTPWGLGCAMALILVLVLSGWPPFKSRGLSRWVFSGAVLSTLLVDGLFWIAAAAVA